LIAPELEASADALMDVSGPSHSGGKGGRVPQAARSKASRGSAIDGFIRML
jgi:hypothetical protein